MSENNDKRTATQKIEDLEKVVTMLYQATSQNKTALENLFRLYGDMTIVKDALKILNKKTEAIIQVAAPETGITVAAVSALVVKMNVEDLTAQVAGFVASGHLTPAEEVADNSYLVCEEYAEDGTLTNPRIQFRLDSQEPTTAESLKGKKAGETVSFGPNKFSAKILEVYTITEPKAPEAPALTGDAAAPAAEVTPAVETAPATTAGAFDAPPTETPVAQFVPSDSSTMATA